jgi:hypothetical protein
MCLFLRAQCAHLIEGRLNKLGKPGMFLYVIDSDLPRPIRVSECRQCYDVRFVARTTHNGSRWLGSLGESTSTVP